LGYLLGGVLGQRFGWHAAFLLVGVPGLLLAGILGTLAGGWLGDLWQKKSGKGYLLISSWGFLIGTPLPLGHPGPRSDRMHDGDIHRRVFSFSQHRTTQYRHYQRRHPDCPRHSLCGQHLLYPCPVRRGFSLDSRLAVRQAGIATPS
jgi:hypothetical protein